MAAMIFEWKLAATMGEAQAKHGYHGICNGGVSEPYADFIHQLRTMSESGDTNRLRLVLRRPDEHSRDIYDVWLEDKRDAYKTSIYEILKCVQQVAGASLYCVNIRMPLKSGHFDVSYTQATLCLYWFSVNVPFGVEA